jgi:hypothetical protein
MAQATAIHSRANGAAAIIKRRRADSDINEK